MLENYIFFLINIDEFIFIAESTSFHSRSRFLHAINFPREIATQYERASRAKVHGTEILGLLPLLIRKSKRAEC